MDLGRLASFLLTVLAVLLPFEARRPLLDLGYAQVTDVEALLYLVLLIWVIGRVAGRWRCWTVGHTCVLVFALAILLSALVAPVERAAALKFALRTLGGCALFFAAADLSADSRCARRYAAALVLGAGISAVAGCVEAAWPRASSWLEMFKTEPSMIGPYLRASGTFQYANIAAMYWEAAVPLTLALILSREDRHGGWTRAWLLIGALLVIVEAVMLSLSRAAICVALVLSAVCVMWACAIPPARRKAIAACALASMLPVLGHLWLSPSFRLRLRTPDESSWYRAKYAVGVHKLEVRPGEVFTLPVSVRNLGAMTWPAGGAHRVTLGYHWEDRRRGGFVVWDGKRTPLPDDIPPGREADMRALVQAPSLDGAYVLHIDMVHEGATWFSLQGSPSFEIPAAMGSAEQGSPRAPLFKPEAVRSPDRAGLWHTALMMWKSHPILGVGPDNFRLVWGQHQGLTSFDRRIHSNNLYLEMSANLGSVGLLAFLAVSGAVLAMWRRLWLVARDSEMKLLTLGLGVSIAAFYLHGLLDYFFEFTATYALFWLLTGIIAGVSHSRRRA